MSRRRNLCLVVLALLALAPIGSSARVERRVEVVEVQGIIDGPVEHAIKSTIRDAARDHAQLVVIQLDSLGAVGPDRASNLIDRIRASRVPVAVWIPPQSRATNSAAVLAIAAHYTSMGPGARLGPILTDNLASSEGRDSVRQLRSMIGAAGERIPFDRSIGPATARARHISNSSAAAVTDLLEQIDGRRLRVAGRTVRPNVAPERTEIRFRKLGLIGGVLHASAKPSITYLLFLLGLVGIVFELFHPSTGPAGAAGVLSLALAVYGMVTLNGSWESFVAICLGVALFCLDLATQRFGPLTIVGFALLVFGSIFLFSGPYLRASPYVIAFGVIAMTMFLVGAMTRVLRDLRALARGEIEVSDPHPHPNGQGG